ncbi:calcium uptake protein 2, mitochondrial isoform X1 [Ictalurus punctatus]|uniref:Calcium uptake protein 2, mitochondrial isoform X1 n=1 Tax=Ictalurus punctatus TaxID=7998 RepID=A0A2D0QEW9_ICTPU|nr:calcium uptake protein 2, mitochondrial isoform X1 [Ictalurus punctatus]
MATWGRFGASLRNFFRSSWTLSSKVPLNPAVGGAVLGCLVAGGVFRYRQELRWKCLHPTVYAKETADDDTPVPAVSMRRLRFNQFASVIYEHEPYMTPRDFLYSIMLEHLEHKLKKRHLTKAEVEKMLTVASKAKAGNNLFRGIGDNGLISYTEYLFLLTILTKPHTGFNIAFKMLDIDGNEQVDKKEFEKLKKIIRQRKVAKEVAEAAASEDSNEPSTTLQAFFFGRKGQNKLQYTEFCRFMEDLQAEVQEMEFLQFSKGMDTMRREDFADWLLHYTNEEDNSDYLENLRKRIPTGQSINFEEFKAFCLFTNNLEDFSISVKMIADANRPIGMAQFKRAVKIATGQDLSENVLDTVFQIFDLDGDNCLSHEEFIAVMKDRMLRGLRVQSQQGVSGFWKCVKKETLKGAQEALSHSNSPF